MERARGEDLALIRIVIEIKEFQLRPINNTHRPCA